MATLKELRKQLEREREKLKIREEKKIISKELDILQNPKKYKLQKVLKKAGTNFLRLSKSAGKGISEYAKKLEKSNRNQDQTKEIYKTSKKNKTKRIYKTSKKNKTNRIYKTSKKNKTNRIYRKPKRKKTSINNNDLYSTIIDFSI